MNEQNSVLPQTVTQQIASHNVRCANTINAETVKRQAKAEEDARFAQEQAAKEKDLQEQRTARLKSVQADALAAWKTRIASSAFVPPVDGWMEAAALPRVFYYIILPGTGLESNCHFAMDGAKPALDCLGVAGRNDYFSLQSNGRWYLLKSKWTGSGTYAGTVKDGGTTVCLRKAGCYRVLAEVRQEPSELPDKLQVPAPKGLTLTYSNDDFSFNYPQNWRAEERKNNDNAVVAVTVTPPEAHLASWVTHGLFIGHVAALSSKFPQSLDGAYVQFATIQRQRGLTFSDARGVVPVGDSQGKIAFYTAPSVFNAPENGWIVVVKDKSDGYYWLLMFYPSNEDAKLYTQIFGEITKSLIFKK